VPASSENEKNRAHGAIVALSGVAGWGERRGNIDIIFTRPWRRVAYLISRGKITRAFDGSTLVHEREKRSRIAYFSLFFPPPLFSAFPRERNATIVADAWIYPRSYRVFAHRVHVIVGRGGVREKRGKQPPMPRADPIGMIK